MTTLKAGGNICKSTMSNTHLSDIIRPYMASVTKTRISKFRLSLYTAKKGGKLLPICLPKWEGKQADGKNLGRYGNAK